MVMPSTLTNLRCTCIFVGPCISFLQTKHVLQMKNDVKRTSLMKTVSRVIITATSGQAMLPFSLQVSEWRKGSDDGSNARNVISVI